MSLTAALAAATLSTAAMAADWALVLRDASGQIFFVDRDSIRTMSNGYKRAWMRLVYAKPSRWGNTSSKNLIEFDCRERRLRSLQKNLFRGREVTRTDSEITEWLYADPEGDPEALLNFVCFAKLPE